VTAVSVAVHPPLWDQAEAEHLFTSAGDTVRPGESYVGYIAADAQYLSTVGTRVLHGRGFTADDRGGAAPVMIVSDELARRVWPGRVPLGECLRLERADGACHTIVGVVENARRFAVVEDPQPVFYVPLGQRPGRPASDGAGAVVVRVSGTTEAVVSRLRSAVRDTATTLRGRQVIALTELLAPQYGPWELAARLFAGLAALALALAFLGLYGVLNYVVSARTRELGVRRALGAGRRQMVAHVVHEAFRHVAVGALVGVAIALVVSGRVASLLYGVSPHDPVVLVGAAAVLLLGAGAAAVVPARRAMAIDPMRAMRED
jgi:putative ABC transport system permease protein